MKIDKGRGYEITSKSDVYAFGVIVFETLFQRKLFSKSQNAEFVYEFLKSRKKVDIESSLIERRDAENSEIFNTLYNSVFAASFQFEADRRPSFSDLMDVFANLQGIF